MGHLLAYVLVLAGLLSSAAAPRFAAAASPSAAGDAEGRAQFDRGQGLFNAKRFIEAARAFEAGYAASGRPQFLYNVAQSYRRANELVKAKEAYKKLLELDPKTYRRKEVEDHLATIEDALAVQAPAPEPKSPPPPAPGPRPVVPSSVLPSAPPPPVNGATSRADVNATAQAPSESIFRRPWFWIVVGGLVAAGATAAAFAIRSDGSSCNATLCVSETRP